MILAETSPDAGHLLNFWLILALIVPTLVNAIALIDRLANRSQKREISPDPLRVQEAERFVTREHCQLAHAAFTQRMDAIAREVEKQDSLRRTDVNNIYVTVNKIDKEVGSLAADVRTALSQIARVDDKIKR